MDPSTECKGSWSIGNNCGACSKCLRTIPDGWYWCSFGGERVICYVGRGEVWSTAWAGCEIATDADLAPFVPVVPERTKS